MKGTQSQNHMDHKDQEWFEQMLAVVLPPHGDCLVGMSLDYVITATQGGSCTSHLSSQSCCQLQGGSSGTQEVYREAAEIS